MDDAHLRTLFDTMRESFYVAEVVRDTDGKPIDYRYVELNPAFEALTGLLREQAVGQRAGELFPDRPPTLLERYGRVADTGEPDQFEIFFPANQRWYDVRAYPAGHDRFCVLYLEITARKAQEAELADSETQFRTFAQSMPNQVWAAQADGMLDWFSDRALDYIGLGFDDLKGNGWAQAVHPDDLSAAATRWAAALSSGEIYETEFRVRRADGAYRWHLARAAPIRNDQGKVIRWIGTNTDIEDQRQLTSNLSLARNELSILLNSAGSAIYSVGTDGATTSCNTEFLRILGFSNIAEVIGRRLHDVIHHSHPDGRPYPKETCPIYLCARNGTEAHVSEELFYRKNGTGIPVEYWVRPLYRDEKLYGAICTFNEITERKRAEEQRALLFSELNHRVKNLFALVGGLVALSARAATSPREMAEALQGRINALSRAHELIQPGLRTDYSAPIPGTKLSDLIAQIFSPYMVPDSDGRISLAGPALKISTNAVTGMALILHELATNAAKYGALHVLDGKLDVTWDLIDGRLNLHWHESGTSAIGAPPKQSGFGSVLLRRSVENQFGGTLNYDWQISHLAIEISVPLSRITDV